MLPKFSAPHQTKSISEHNQDKLNRLFWLKYATNKGSGAKNERNKIHFALACTTILAGLSLSGGTMTAQAADLGGNCCADLEERVAELEATTVSHGNRRPTLGLSPNIRIALRNASLPYQLSLLNDEDLAKAMQRLTPWSHAPFIQTMLTADKSFGNALMSCPTQGGNNKVTKEGQCSWFKVTGGVTEHDTNSNGPGFEQSFGGFAGGVQFALQDQWRFGFGGALEMSDIDIADNTQHYSSSEGTQLTVGTVLKNQWGNLNGYFTATGSQGWYATRRNVDLNNIGNKAESSQRNSSVRGNARFTYLFDQGGFYLKPGIDLSGQYLHLGGYTETGAGGANITQSSSSQWVFGLTPSLELGTSFQQANGMTFRPYIKAGYTFLNEDTIKIGGFIGDPNQPFATITGEHVFEKTSATLEAGLTILTQQGFDLKLNYEGTFSEDTTSHIGGAKVSFKF